MYAHPRHTNRPCNLIAPQLAETEGFEPSVRLYTVRRFSKPESKSRYLYNYLNCIHYFWRAHANRVNKPLLRGHNEGHNEGQSSARFQPINQQISITKDRRVSSQVSAMSSNAVRTELQFVMTCYRRPFRLIGKSMGCGWAECCRYR